MPARRTSLPRRSAPGRPAGSFRSPHSHFHCTTRDEVGLAGTLLGRRESETAIVLVHGFMGYRTKPASRRLADDLGSLYAVFTFDLRGHGQSEGACTGGAVEHLDVDAVVSHARKEGYGRIVTVGWSLGGIAVVRQAAELGAVDGVVSISTPAVWNDSRSKAVRRASWLFVSPIGRVLARRLMGTRIDLRTDMGEPPVAVVGRISPVPILIVHGADDHFFGVDAAHRLFEAAGDPKRLLVFDRFGHAEDGFSRAFAARLSGEIDGMLARP